jgi:glycosyltransferase involved in cell wall biosynthesis
MKSLGISMIVKNESEMICKCLDSVKGADEIVIVDTGSEDNTVELCKKYTDKVYTDYKWNDDFAEARNYSLSKCTTDFVLIIDADETLQCSIEGIRQVLKFMTKDVSGHTIRYMGMLFTCKTQIETVEQIRVIRRVPEIKWESAVHNMLTINGSNPLLKVACYKTNFEVKSGYSPSHFIDPNRSLRILEKQLELDGTNVRYMYYIAREYISRRMDPANKDQVPELHDKIIYWLEKHESIAFYQDWTNELADALYCLSLAYFEKVTETKDVRWWYKGIVAAMKSFMVLPSYAAPAKLLSDAMMSLPGHNKYPAASKFWAFVASKCSNEGVGQIREIK